MAAPYSLTLLNLCPGNIPLPVCSSHETLIFLELEEILAIFLL